MGLRVNTNIASINAQRNTAQATTRLAHNYQRLSTGLRIATAADDAAGLAISERLRSQVRSLSQASMETLAIVAYLGPCTRPDVARAWPTWRSIRRRPSCATTSSVAA